MTTQQTSTKVSSSQRGFVAWQGLSFGHALRFLQLRPPLHWSRIPRLCSTFAASALNSVLNRLERWRFKSLIEQTKLEHPPLFVLGHWRSGTTLLHNLLARDPRFTYPNLYHVMFPGHFLLTESVVTRLTAPLLPQHRPMDNMPCGWSLPQEDETALCLMTLASPYLMLAFHQQAESYDRFFELRDVSPAERQAWKAAMLQFMQKLTVREPKQIVLKSPTHTFRIPLLLEMFPDAKFVYIYRNPYRVFHSTMHLRRTLFEANGLAPLDERNMEQEVFRVYEYMFRVYERDRHQIPAGNLHEVRFEDLESDPVGQLRQVYEQLRLPDFSEVEPDLQQEAERLRGYRKNSYQDDPETMRRIYERLQFAFDRYGYPSALSDSADTAAEMTGTFGSLGEIPSGIAAEAPAGSKLPQAVKTQVPSDAGGAFDDSAELLTPLGCSADGVPTQTRVA